uniref:Uncharacterized protein n=1 Tax=Rhizophora mucronata TaxID=61149 RepID=A0A2P2JLG9_RHIMU
MPFGIATPAFSSDLNSISSDLDSDSSIVAAQKQYSQSPLSGPFVRRN